MKKHSFFMTQILRVGRFLTLGVVFVLAGCLGEDTNVGKQNADTELEAIKANDSGLYGVTLARFAQHARDRLSQVEGDLILGDVDFATYDIQVPSLPVAPKVSVCMDTDDKSMILVWLDGRNAQDAFYIPRVGFRVTDMLIAMGAETFGGQVGVFETGRGLTLLNNQNKELGGACTQVARIPKGAPVVALPLNTRIKVVEPRNSIEYRTIECEGDASVGARVQKRAVRYAPDGSVLEAQSWEDMDTGTCKNMVNIAVNVDSDTVGSDAIGRFAASSLQELLSQRVQYIDCLRTNLRKDDGEAHVIDSCANIADMDVADVVSDVTLDKGADEVVISCTGTLPSNAQPFRLTERVDTTIHWGGNATLVRARNNTDVSTNGQRVNVDIWVGKDSALNGIQCDATDKLHADCLLIDVAPPLVARSNQKWSNSSKKVDTTPGVVSDSHYIIDGIAHFWGDNSWSWGNIWGCSKQAWMPDFTGADCMHSGYMDAKFLNADYYRENVITRNEGVRGEKIDDMHVWENPSTFKPKISRVGEWELTGLACEWTKREPTAECPDLMAQDNRQGDWQPYGLTVMGGMPKAMSGPGMSVGARFDSPNDNLLWIRQIHPTQHIFNTVQNEYNALVAGGNFVAELRRRYTRYVNQCVFFFGCWRDEIHGSVVAGPGADTIYLKAWRSGNTQTTLINTDGVRRKHEAYAVSKNEIGIRPVPGREGYIDPVHCAKSSTTTFTRPATVHTRWQNCFLSFCGWDYGSYGSSVTITEHSLQEWRSDLGHSVTVKRYSSSPNMGTWNDISQVPSSFSWSDY